MMEVMDPLVEAGVLWLAQSILANLLAGKLEAWIRQVGLADAADRLRSEIERVEAVVGALKGRAADNRPLARSLRRLKELLYDADDLVDELDYYMLLHQVEGVTWHEPEDTDADGAEQGDVNTGVPSSSDRKKRSKAWDEFRVTETFDDGKPAKAECVHCHAVVRCETTKGTSVLHNHLKSESCKRKRAAIGQAPNPSSVGDGAPNVGTFATRVSDSRKRMRTNEASAHNTAANIHVGSKTEFSSRIQEMADLLQKAVNEIQNLHVSDSVISSSPYRSTTADACQRTSSILPRKMYGRVAEKNSIIDLMTRQKSEAITVVPIVGIGGIGKTALAQLIYNDQVVKSQFELRIWVWVSKNFDEVRLTREMLDFVSRERHEGISSFAKLQEVLIGSITSKRLLLILDDVWDITDEYIWNKLLAPFKSDDVKGNVILVTTRSLSVAKRVGTVKPIELGALEKDDFWLLFKRCAFGDDKYEGHPSLNIIGQQIEEKLHGNPLAAENAGMLLRDNLTVDHWSSTLKKETWKSLKLNNSIMNALKLSYEDLPYSLQQCLLYCSIFPKNHQFLSNELVSVWISQGFVKYDYPTRRLEDIGRGYLSVLFNSGFFVLNESYNCTAGNQACYVMPALMHDFVRLVSRTEYAVIDGSECNEMLPTIRHLSIVTDSAYNECQRGNIIHNEKFEEIFPSVVNSLRKLRTLLLIGKCDDSFVLIFQKAQSLRMLQISATYTDLDFLLRNNCTHLRYLKVENEGSDEASLAALNKSFHLQVLDVGHPTILNIMYGLVSMRHLSVKMGAQFMDRNSICFEIIQLQPMSDLVHLHVDQLQTVSGAEACRAKLKDKQQLETLHLSWTYNTLSLEEYVMQSTFGPQYDSITQRDVLEGLEPYHNLKHLQISGYSGATSPDWLGTSVTSLQTLNLKDCREWQRLPSLQRLPFLTKLQLRNMSKVVHVSLPSSLEELVLIEMPKLERCSCNSVRDLNSSLRVLQIERCEVLENFTLFEGCEKLKIDHKSWLPHLNELTMHECPNLKVLNPLPPASNICKISISRISTLATMKGSSNGELIIGERQRSYFDMYSCGLRKLDHRILSLHNLRALAHLQIQGCQSLLSISLKGFSQLICLKSLEIWKCESLFSSDVLPEHIHEDMAHTNFNALPSLQYLKIDSCGITGKWLSIILRHAPALVELHLQKCQQIPGLLIEGQEISLPDPTSTPWASTPGNPGHPLPSSIQDKFLCIPLNLTPLLRKMSIIHCYGLKILTSKEGFLGCISLEELRILGCPELMPSLVHKKDDWMNGRCLLPHSLVQLEVDNYPETLYPYFSDSLIALKTLGVRHSLGLKSLQLHTCMALEELRIADCVFLEALEGLQSLHSLRSLQVSKCPRLTSLQLRSCTALEELKILGCWSLEALEGFESLGCLRNLEVIGCPRLESVPLHSCAALEKLEFGYCESLRALEGFEFLGCLKNFEVVACPGLPPCLEHLSTQVYELCPRLERFQIDDYSFLTISLCKHLTCLQRLDVCGLRDQVTELTAEQESALQLLTSLQELVFRGCHGLADLPMGLSSLPSLKRLEISCCKGISRLPEKGLPPSLEDLEVFWCSNNLSKQCFLLASKNLNEQCRALATPKLRVKIDANYVN